MSNIFITFINVKLLIIDESLFIALGFMVILNSLDLQMDLIK
jgi:hypothetical protein